VTVVPRLCRPARCSPRAWFMRSHGCTYKTLRLTWPLDWVFLKVSFCSGVVLRMERWVLQLLIRCRPFRARMVERLLTNGVVQRTRYFPNWVVIAANQAQRAKGWLSREELGIPAGRRGGAVFGQLGEQTGTHGIPAAARLLKSRQDLAVRRLGDGLMKPSLETALAGLPNVRLLPLQPSGRLSELLAMAISICCAAEPGRRRFGPAVETVRNARQRSSRDWPLAVRERRSVK